MAREAFRLSQRPATEPAAKQVVDFKSGNEMAALAAKQINFHVMGYYPITPSTEVAENLDAMWVEGAHGIRMIPADGEHSAAGICYGASTGGGRVLNVTSSQGLLYSLEQLPVQSGTRFPMVLNVATRSVSGPLDIRGDHSDIYYALNAGWIVLLASDPQSVYDMNFIAVRIGEHPKVRLPVLVAYDGFFTSHQKRRVNVLEDERVRRFVGEASAPFTTLDLDRPVTVGPYMNDPDLINSKYQLKLAFDAARTIIPKCFTEYAKLSGRSYGTVERYSMDDADVALVLLNSAAETAKDAVDRLRQERLKVGVLSLSMLRPFPVDELRAKHHVRISDDCGALGAQIGAGERTGRAGLLPARVEDGGDRGIRLQHLVHPVAADEQNAHIAQPPERIKLPVEHAAVPGDRRQCGRVLPAGRFESRPLPAPRITAQYLPPDTRAEIGTVCLRAIDKNPAQSDGPHFIGHEVISDPDGPILRPAGKRPGIGAFGEQPEQGAHSQHRIDKREQCAVERPIVRPIGGGQTDSERGQLTRRNNIAGIDVLVQEEGANPGFSTNQGRPQQAVRPPHVRQVAGVNVQEPDTGKREELRRYDAAAGIHHRSVRRIAQRRRQERIRVALDEQALDPISVSFESKTSIHFFVQLRRIGLPRRYPAGHGREQSGMPPPDFPRPVVVRQVLHPACIRRPQPAGQPPPHGAPGAGAVFHDQQHDSRRPQTGSAHAAQVPPCNRPVVGQDRQRQRAHATERKRQVRAPRPAFRRAGESPVRFPARRSAA